MKKFLSLILGAGSLLVAMPPAEAWKIETHIWIGRQILVEALTGSVTIAGRPYALPSYVRDSIAENPDTFVVGALGADIYPDMLSGQFTTHPGLPTKDCRKPNKPRCSPHPAVAPVYAVLGRPVPDMISREWTTDDWLRHVVQSAFGASATPRASKDTAFAYGYLLHAAMDMWAHSYVNIYSGGVFSLSDNQEIPARHMAIESYIKHRHEDILAPTATQSSGQARIELGRVVQNRLRLIAKPNDTLSSLEAPIEFVRRTLLLNAVAAEQYSVQTATLPAWSMYTYWNEVRRLRSDFNGVQTAFQKAVSDAGKAVDGADTAWKAAQSSYTSAVNGVTQAQAALSNAESGLLAAEREVRRFISSITDQMMQNVPEPFRSAYFDAKRAVVRAEEDVKKAKANRDKAAAGVTDKLAALNLRKETRSAITQLSQQRIPGIDSGLKSWQESVERAADAYILAWEDTGKELMRPKGNRFQNGSDPTEPLKQWVKCWGPTFGLPGGVPGSLPALCQDASKAYKSATENLKQLIVNSVLDEALREMIVQLDEDVAKISGQLVLAIAGLVSNGLRLDANGELQGVARTLINLRDKDTVTDGALNDEFRVDISGQNLLKFPNTGGIAALLRQDMGLSDNAPKAENFQGLPGFAALQNAATMSRLTLLHGAGLNQLVERSAGKSPYAPNDWAGAVLFGAIASIDGDHQWQPIAPGLPRENRTGRFNWELGAQFGHSPSISGKPGMRLWQDPVVRNCVWDRIIAGPLTPGLLQNYPFIATDFRAAGKNSWPSNDQKPAVLCAGDRPSSPADRVPDRLPTINQTVRPPQ